MMPNVSDLAAQDEASETRTVRQNLEEAGSPLVRGLVIPALGFIPPAPATVAPDYSGMADLERRLAAAERKLGIALAALQTYRDVDDETFRFVAGFKAKPEMRDPRSIAGRALDRIERMA